MALLDQNKIDRKRATRANFIQYGYDTLSGRIDKVVASHAEVARSIPG